MSTAPTTAPAGKSTRSRRDDIPAPAAKSSRSRRDNIHGWAFSAPFLVFFLTFLVWPMISGAVMSLTGKSLTGANSGFIGLANYTEAFADQDMWRSLGNTLYFTLISTVPLVVIALALAALVNMGLPAQWLWRLSFFSPFLLASTVVSLFFAWMYNPELGLFNDLLANLGIPPVAWLNDPSVAMWADRDCDGLVDRGLQLPAVPGRAAEHPAAAL